MYCIVCNNELYDCVCPDIEERLRAIGEHPNWALTYCKQCSKVVYQCNCPWPKGETEMRTIDVRQEQKSEGIEVHSIRRGYNTGRVAGVVQQRVRPGRLLTRYRNLYSSLGIRFIAPDNRLTWRETLRKVWGLSVENRKFELFTPFFGILVYNEAASVGGAKLYDGIDLHWGAARPEKTALLGYPSLYKHHKRIGWSQISLFEAETKYRGKRITRQLMREQ